MTSTTTIATVASKIASVVNRGAWNGSITTSGGNVTIPVGYHNGSGKVTGPTLATLVGGNVNLDNNARLLSGYTAYGKNGTKYTGSIVNRGAWNDTISTRNGSVTIPAGYHNGSGEVNVNTPVSVSIYGTHDRGVGTKNTQPIYVNPNSEGCFVIYGDALFPYDNAYVANANFSTTGIEKGKSVYWDQIDNINGVYITRAVFMYIAYLKKGQTMTVSFSVPGAYLYYSYAVHVF